MQCCDARFNTNELIKCGDSSNVSVLITAGNKAHRAVRLSCATFLGGSTVSLNESPDCHIEKIIRGDAEEVIALVSADLEDEQVQYCPAQPGLPDDGSTQLQGQTRDQSGEAD